MPVPVIEAQIKTWIGTATTAGTRVSVDFSPRTSYTMTQEPRRLIVKLDADAMLITRGAEGMSLFERGGRLLRLTQAGFEIRIAVHTRE